MNSAAPPSIACAPCPVAIAATMMTTAPVIDVAAHSGVQLQVRDNAGHPIATTAGFAAAEEPQSSEPILVKGRRVGTVQVGLTASGLGAADNVLRTALLRAIAGTAGLAALLALHHRPRRSPC